jgi:serine/threonine protein phosphatase 1
MKTVIVGDVHGCFAKLCRLLDLVGWRGRIIFLGDLIDKGPHSVEVVRLIRLLSASPHFDVTVLRGNHEDKFLRYLTNCDERPDVAEEMRGRSPALEELRRSLSPEDVAFLRSTVPFVRVPEHNLLCVHGGIPGTMTEFPASVEEAQALTGKRRREFDRILRTRYVDVVTGEYLTMEDVAKRLKERGLFAANDVHWAYLYDGRFGHVIYGHDPAEDVIRWDHATGIDTGAVYGGHLTALIYNDGAPGPDVVSVKSNKYIDRD